MEEFHKRRINENIKDLVNNTHYEVLVDSFEKCDKLGVIPKNLMTKWKERRSYGYNSKQLNGELYTEIQRRGPNAFKLLTTCLQNSGHENLAIALDQTLSVQEVDDDQSMFAHEQYYPEDGTHCVYFEEHEACLCDRLELQSFFNQLGYKEFKESDVKPDIASLIVINFCCMSSGEVARERDWVYDKFQEDYLEGKPKILLSFRYESGDTGEALVQQDSGKMTKRFRDLLQIKIPVNKSNKNSTSDEVKHFIRVFGDNDSLHLIEKVKKLTGEFQKLKLKEIEKHDSAFSKRFRLQKPSQNF